MNYLYRYFVSCFLSQVISGVLELEAGWYSAMAQGQAMSLLVRAAHHSGDSSYLKAAIHATALFSVNATHGRCSIMYSVDAVRYCDKACWIFNQHKHLCPQNMLPEVQYLVLLGTFDMKRNSD